MAEDPIARMVLKNSFFLCLCLIAVWLAPLVVLGAAWAHLIGPSKASQVISHLLFFAPQYVFGLNEFVKPIPYGFHPLLERPISDVVVVVGWLGVAFGFGWVAKRARPVVSVGCAAAVVLVVTVLVHAILGSIGYTIQLDGP